MDTEADKPASPVELPEPVRFRAAPLLLWLPACLVCGLATAWLAVIAGDYFAPFLLFPLLVGAVAGAVVTAMVRLSQIGNRFTILLGTVMAGLAVVAGQHYFKYLAAYRPAPKDVQAFQKVAPLAPSFQEYLEKTASLGRRINGRNVGGATLAWFSWTLEGLLILGTSLAMTTLAARQPYCSRCRSWYHTTRSGRLDHACATELAQAVGVALPARLVWTRYRLATCKSGCGPTSLTLYWEDTAGRVWSQRVWLGSDLRHQVTEILDRQMEPSDHEGEEPPKSEES